MKFPLAVGSLLGIAGFLVMTGGYGVVLYYSWFLLLPLFGFLSLPSIRSKDWQTWLARLGIITAIFSVLTAAGLGVLLQERMSTCRALAPILAELEARRRSTGSYPADLSGIPHPPGLAVHVGEIGLAEIDEYDAIFRLAPDNAMCVVPLTKPLPMSITRFYVYEWSTEKPEWSIVKCVWLLGGDIVR